MSVEQEQVVGVVGALSSDSTLAVSRFFTQMRVPTVSYAASSPDLDDSINHPFFLRTVPSDEEQSIAMTEVRLVLVGLANLLKDIFEKGDDGHGHCDKSQTVVCDS